MADVELIGVTKRFDSVAACTDVNLHVREGEFVTLLGPSGCGKTTTLNLVAGLDDLTSGEVRMDGKVVNDLTPYERDVAMVFQSYALYPHMTVEQNIGFTLKLRKRKKAEIRERVRAVAEMLELSHVLDRLPRQLSGGQQQRVALGRAVIREPRVFLFDEPFSNLDAKLRLRMRVEVKELHQRLGITSLFVTHDQEEAMSLSDRIAIMREGHIEQVGTPDEVYLQPVSKYVGTFIGSPQMNILSGEVVQQDGGLRYKVGAEVFTIPDSARPDTERPMELGVRPEHVELGSQGTPMTILVTQPLGSMTYVTVGAGDDIEITARVQGMAHYAPGDSIPVSFAPEGLLFFDRETGRRALLDGSLVEPSSPTEVAADAPEPSEP